MSVALVDKHCEAIAIDIGMAGVEFVGEDRVCIDSNAKRTVVRPPMLALPKSTSITVQRPQCLRGRIEEETSSGLMWSVAARRGRRRTNREDMFSVLPFVDYGPNQQPLSIFAVYDGHGGRRASQFASTRLPVLFLDAFHKQQNDVSSALDAAFLATDEELLQSLSHRPTKIEGSDGFSRTNSGSFLGSITLQRGTSQGLGVDLQKTGFGVRQKDLANETPHSGSGSCFGQASLPRSRSRAEEQVAVNPVTLEANCGTTATVMVLIGLHLTIAHVGDSRAVLGGASGRKMRLSEDHRPSRPDERERIESAGGLILTAAGTSRVNGVLAVSRALGDQELKQLVIAKPEISNICLKGNEEFVVIASDGLWDVISDDEAVGMVCDVLESSQDGFGRQEDDAAKVLVQNAWDRGSNDDVSVIVVDLLKYWELYQEEDIVCTNSKQQPAEEAVLEIKPEAFAKMNIFDTTPGWERTKLSSSVSSEPCPAEKENRIVHQLGPPEIRDSFEIKK